MRNGSVLCVAELAAGQQYSIRRFDVSGPKAVKETGLKSKESPASDELPQAIMEALRAVLEPHDES